MDKYRRVSKPIEEEEKETAPNVIRITNNGEAHSYLSYAVRLLEAKDTVYSSIYLKAMGSALSTAIIVAEKLRSSKEGLHQVIKVNLVETVTVYEPLEEGLDSVETVRQIPTISIQLSYSIDDIDTKDVGYQKPLPSELIKPYYEKDRKFTKKSRKFKKQDKNKDKQNENDENKQEANNEDTNAPSSPTKKFKNKGGKKGKTGKENQDIEVDGQEEDEQTKKEPKQKKNGAKKHDKTKQENIVYVETETNGELEDKEQVDGKETKAKRNDKKHRTNGYRGHRQYRGSRSNGQQVESSENATDDAAPAASVEPASA